MMLQKRLKKIQEKANIKYKLSNKELASFIYQMFDLNKINKYKDLNYKYKDISIHFENSLNGNIIPSYE